MSGQKIRKYFRKIFEKFIRTNLSPPTGKELLTIHQLEKEAAGDMNEFVNWKHLLPLRYPILTLLCPRSWEALANHSKSLKYYARLMETPAGEEIRRLHKEYYAIAEKVGTQAEAHVEFNKTKDALWLLAHRQAGIIEPSDEYYTRLEAAPTQGQLILSEEINARNELSEVEQLA